MRFTYAHTHKTREHIHLNEFFISFMNNKTASSSTGIKGKMLEKNFGFIKNRSIEIQVRTDYTVYSYGVAHTHRYVIKPPPVVYNIKFISPKLCKMKISVHCTLYT